MREFTISVKLNVQFMCIMFVFFKDMVGDDEIDVSGPGHGEIFSEKNLVE